MFASLVDFINMWKCMGESMVKYIEKVDKRISSLKRGSFSWKHKKVNSNFS
jgi:hypothetical protein